jgi:DNA-binding GntR family transcriptional regulator
MPKIQEVLPKYLQIAGHIRDQIVRGDLRPGDEVPSERELAATWTVARPTAARALEVLRTQGLVESRQGSGTYVRARRGVPRARERYERARDLGTMYGAAESVEFVATEIVTGPAHVTEALQVPAGSRLARRTRLLRGEGSRPIELSTSWFTAAVAEQAPRLLKPERLFGGTGKYIAEVTGRESEYARDQVAARLATSNEARLLELSEPAAVLIYRLTAYDAKDQPVQFDEAAYPPDHWTFRQEYPLAPVS